MDTRVRRRLAPEARKLEIIEAAERLLQSQGSRVRVEDVVREAGVAKGTFFLYFPTWDDLLETVRQRLVAEFDAAHPLPTEVVGPVDWPAVVAGQARAFIVFASTRPGIGQGAQGVHPVAEGQSVDPRDSGRRPVMFSWFSIVLPCHRVVGSDGSLTGFAGGLGAKAWLLAFERGTPGGG